MTNAWTRGGVRRAPRGAAARWRKAPSRSEKSERIRRALVAAAADVVGEVGYADASISLITQRAGVAQGTFYNYFDSRQDIFDELLPALGAQMLAHVAEQARGGRTFAELEERSFVSFFSYLKKSPRFFRVLNEAENFAPKAYRQHFDVVSRRYLAFLKRSHRNGEFPAFTEQELEVVVFILMAARSYIALRYASAEHGQHGVPEWVVRAYMKLILNGLKGAPRGGKRRATRGDRPRS
jgi:AcrR family transcriptional regulator